MAGNPGHQPQRSLNNLPEPAALHVAFSTHHPLNWGNPLPTKAQLAATFGDSAVLRSLNSLQARIQSEPATTGDFLAALPPGVESYKLESRVKSPQSLARKVRDFLETLDIDEPDDILRYTVLTAEADDLVDATTATVAGLSGSGWRVRRAYHSYTEGSRYKGFHAGMHSAASGTVEVQFHSAASMAVKEATTAQYKVERSADATPADRMLARLQSIELANSLRPPAGLLGLSHLGGVPVAVKTLGDSREHVDIRGGKITGEPAHRAGPIQNHLSRTDDGIAR